MRLAAIDQQRKVMSELAAFAAIGLCVLVIGERSVAATSTAPVKQHHWQRIEATPLARVEARACTDCPAALELKCLGGPASGLLELSLPVAGVANGREGATKQIRFIAGVHVIQRRATTLSRAGRFVPHVALGADDILFARMETSDLLELNFYGQRAYIGLGAQGQRAIHDVRAACWPDLEQSGHNAGDATICTWHVPLGCYPSEDAAKTAGRADAVKTLFTRHDSTWCASAVITDLAAARIFAGKHETYPRRRCVWVAATSGRPSDAVNLAPPAGSRDALPPRQP